MKKGLNNSWNLPQKELDPMRMKNIFCPCINCLNERRQEIGNIWEHLLCDGIKKNYTTWIWHDELIDMQKGSQAEPIDVEMGDRLKDMIRDLGQESF